MSEREITVETPDGPMKCFVVQPDGEGPFPVVIELMDAPGVRDELKDIARTYSAAGLMVVLPDLYHHFGEDLSFVSDDIFGEDSEDLRAEMVALLGRLEDSMIVADVGAVLEHLKGDEAASDGPKGCFGFCLGGRGVIRSMAAFADEFAAGAAIHPSRVVTEDADSPHLDIPAFKGEIYFGLGSVDPMTPPPVIEQIEEQLEKGAIANVIDVTPGADHGFAMKSFGDRYNPEADRRHYEHSLDLFGRRLAG